MRTVLLAGGFGTRLSEETTLKPKPMVEIGGRPILVHIMELYARQGFKDFIVAGGYKADAIKTYFATLPTQINDYQIDLATGDINVLGNNAPDWKVAIVDTGLHTMTGGRIRRLREHLSDNTFMCTYGDGLANIDVRALLEFHKSHGKLATVTAVHPPARFGALDIQGDRVMDFEEKNPIKEGWINGGFFVLEPGVLDRIDGDEQPFEREPLSRLAEEGELMAFAHEGFWQPMDTLREKNLLESLWADGTAPWVCTN